METLIVRVGEERIGLPVARVVELLPALAAKKLPSAPAGVEGVFSYRGQVVPLLSFRHRLGLPPSPLRASHHIVLFTLDARATRDEVLVAFHVDRCLGVAELPVSEVRDLPMLSHEELGLSGVARLPDGLLLVHDPDSFLTPTDHLKIGIGVEALQGEGAFGSGQSEGSR